MFVLARACLSNMIIISSIKRGNGKKKRETVSRIRDESPRRRAHDKTDMDLQENGTLFLSGFPMFVPEPVLVKRSHLCING